jgi:hypothetical protein
VFIVSFPCGVKFAVHGVIQVWGPNGFATPAWQSFFMKNESRFLPEPEALCKHRFFKDGER